MANKIVQLVDKNSNNLYPVAGAVITDAVSTGAISSQAVTNPKIGNGAVNGVENDATAIGTAKLALDTVGTPNLRDESVTSDKIDFTTLGTQYAVQQNDSTTITTTPTNIASITVSPGKWLFLGECDANNVNDNTAYNTGESWLQLMDNTAVSGISIHYTQKGGGSAATLGAWWTWTIFGVKDISTTSEIILRACLGSASGRLFVKRGKITAIRVG